MRENLGTIRLATSIMFGCMAIGCDTKDQTASNTSSSSPPSQTPAPAVTPTKPAGPSLEDQLRAASTAAANAANAVRAERNACLARLASNPDYAAAKAEAFNSEAAVKTARAANDPSLPTISMQWITAKSAKGKLEVAALDNDAAYKQALANQRLTTKAVYAVEQQIQDQAAAKQAASNQKVADAAAKIEAEATAKRNLEHIACVTGYEENGDVRVDTLAWLEMNRDQKAHVIKSIQQNYEALQLAPFFDVLSDQNDTVLASSSFWSGVSVAH